jgi:hypothetical protein
MLWDSPAFVATIMAYEATASSVFRSGVRYPVAERSRRGFLRNAHPSEGAACRT